MYSMMKMMTVSIGNRSNDSTSNSYCKTYCGVILAVVLSLIASSITRSRSFTIPSHHHQQLHQQQRLPHETPPLFSSLPPGDVASSNAVHTSKSSPLEDAITNYFNTSIIKPFGNDSESHLYLMDDVFKKPYWRDDITSMRFVTSFRDGILYNPEIVNEICTAVAANLAKVPKQGLMIKGPQGSGKSHSIVNVVRKLQSTENYLVTYIPDCRFWHTSFDLVKAICSSFGTNYDLLDLPYFTQSYAYKNEEIQLQEFINAVDAVLQANEKQWVFVFDQINRLFTRFADTKNVGSLPFPFYTMKTVLQVGQITTIISAPANNEISYKDSHPGFLEYIFDRR